MRTTFAVLVFFAFVTLPALGAEMVAGRVIVKLTEEAAARAQALPERALPKGLPELDRLRGPMEITGGFRVIRKRGAPVGDPQLFHEIGLDRIYILEVPDADDARLRELVGQLSRLPWVEYAELDFVGELATTVPNDARFPDQWTHNNTGQSGGTVDADMDSIEAWDLGTGNASGVVAILDTGVDLDHPDLVPNLLAGYDIYNDDPDPEDDHGHGTGTSGIAAARGNNSIYVAGICWNCSILPVKVCSAGGFCSSADVADGMVYAADNGADAISLSLTTRWSQALTDATDYAYGLGALCFGASGNSGGYYGHPPAALSSCVSVGGSNDNDWRVYNYGDQAELTAPTGVVTTWIGDDVFENFGGTSGACPQAAGLAAMLRATDPGLHVRELRHLVRLGADDSVGFPGEDTPGWDQYMGYGRVNANNSMSMIDGPWLALDRPHYVCGGDLTVALKDETAGATATVTLSGGFGADSETVVVNPLTGGGYYEGTIPIAWAGVDGPVIVGDGKLDLAHGETVFASRGPLAADAFLECFKRVCLASVSSKPISGDCDGDRSADPGETWQLSAIVRNLQAERFTDVSMVLGSTAASVVVVDDSQTFPSLHPVDEFTPAAQVAGMTGTFSFHVLDTAAAVGTTPLGFTIGGDGWTSDDAACATAGFPNALSMPLNRDLGPVLASWNFDDGTSMSFMHSVAHGNGNLSECNTAVWGDDWEDLPVTDKSHSGSYSMRVGDGTSYAFNQDAGLATPSVLIPPGGGTLGFRLWIDTDFAAPPAAWEGMIVEAKDRFGTTWNYLPDATYNAILLKDVCGTFQPFPFGFSERVRMFAGDGGVEPAIGGDTFDYEHLADLSAFAGLQTQVRFRFGSNNVNGGVTQGAWVDTVAVYGSSTADTWPATEPANATGSDTNCPTSFDLSWNAVSGAADYAVYRSEVSCADALQSTTTLGTPAASTFSDATVQNNVPYFYAIEARESGTGCVSERACVSGTCVCPLAAEATGLLLERAGDDVALAWVDPSTPGVGWNLYRDSAPDPTTWGGPHAAGITDAEPGTPGIQYVDIGAISAGSTWYYLLTTVNGCGESALR